MQQFEGYKMWIECLWLVFILNTVIGVPQDQVTVKPGRYVPELHGGLLGKYIPDESGKYRHIHRPYDGGYGDRGLKYVHDASGNIISVKSDQAPGILPLGPKDHLRFMIDFNYDNSGWQIIKFEWLRDGDENYQFEFVNENQLWTGDDNDNAKMAEESPANDTENGGESEATDGASDDSDAHIDGEYNRNNGYDYSVTDNKAISNPKNLQDAIKDVLEYIEVNILPTL